MTKIDIELKRWATERQAEIIDSINQNGSQGSAARVLGIAESTIREAIKSVKNKASKAGISDVKIDSIFLVSSPLG